MTADRRGKALVHASTVCLLAVACACAVVFAFHRSAAPGLLGWSPRYLLGAVLPVLAAVAAQTLLVLAPPQSARRERQIALGCLVSGGLLLLLGVELLPLYELPAMAALLGLMAFPLAGYRLFRSDEWLISHIALAALCLVLFVPETARLLREGRIPGDRGRPHWGDQTTFRHLFPESEPFISAGGRLQPNLDLEVFTDVPHRPAYRLETNSDGFRNQVEIARAKAPDELRILNLGDSFSIGCGVAQDRFIGPILEARWPQPSPRRRITVINAEVSDPAYGLLYLQRFGVDYAPDFVFYSYVDNDSHQAYLPFAARRIFSLDAQGRVHTHPISPAESAQRSRAAQMHFAEYLYPRASSARIDVEKGLRSRSLQWRARLTASLQELSLTGLVFESLNVAPDGNDRSGELTFISTRFATSGTAGHLRLVDFASNWGMLYKNGNEMTAPLYANLFRIFRSMQRTAASRGATFVLIYFPRREQVQPQDWRRFQAFWNLDPSDFDLDLEASRLRSFCAEQGIPFIDTTAALRTAAVGQTLYLANDTHFNEQGQAVAAQAILDFMTGYQRSAVRDAGAGA